MSLLQRMNPGNKPAEATKPAAKDEEAQGPRGQLRADLMDDKAAIHKRLVERHASALDVGNRDEVRAKVVELLHPERIGVTLSEEFQLHPEQATDAIVVHHPEAKYFNAR